ncbi:MAG: hypothetical protein M3Y45_00990 [Actinomycetota bacterium]|nr:hypothetical protein [Actinomycetota bacterium]
MKNPPRPGDSQPHPGQPRTGTPGSQQPGPGQPRGSARPQDPRVTQVQSGHGPVPGRQPAAQQRQPVDIATRLDGQRGWLNELEQSLRKRSIIALVLTCLAVGVGAAALYISITKNADGDRIDALESRITALEAATGGTAGTVPGTDSTVPPTDGTLPDTGTTLPDDTTIPPTGTTGTTTPGFELPGD